jgi:hypothetical protein
MAPIDLAKNVAAQVLGVCVLTVVVAAWRFFAGKP